MQPNLDEIRKLQAQGNVIPVYKSVIADFLTPVSAFLKLEKDRSHAFLLESVEGGERIARYSFLGGDPFLVKRYKNGQPADFMQDLRATMARFKSVKLPNLPPFTGGAVGYFGYDMVRTIEDIPQTGVDDLGVDDAVLMFYKTVLAFDHLRHQIHIISNILVDDSHEPLDVQYEKAVAEIQRIEALLRAPLEMPPVTRNETDVTVRSNFEKSAYLAAVDKAKEYIAAGDIFQVVLAQRFEVDLPTAPFEVYRALRIVNPSPYMYFLKMPDTCIVGSSPEMLVRVREQEIEYRPIAGTLPRGASDSEDEANAERLRNDEKERAEHIMLVDLGRNDLGRVSQYGTVRVEELMTIERYSHVMHLVSSLRGKLRQNVDRWDSLMACFPAGTVSGAPKVRAMEIIDELEPTKRGVYAGAVMYADFSNNLDSCIAIRTLVVRGNKGYIQAGGGIVADSVPENEYMETVNKSRALIRAINLAQRMGSKFMILVIDNYDSFTYNLVQYLGELGEDLSVYRNDKISLEEIERMKPERIVISPGPGTPADAGITEDVVRHFHKSTPILGVCLGHQAIGEVFGGKIVRAPTLMHGKVSEIFHDSKGLFAGLPQGFPATRYHSLMVTQIPTTLEISAETKDGIVMGLRHREFPTEGIQFHCESIMTVAGKNLLKNFLKS